MKSKFLIFFICICLGTHAQQKLILASNYLTNTDTVLIYKPDNYNTQKTYPLVYLLHGYSANYKQWSQLTNLKRLANQYSFIIVCPDGFTSFYLDAPFDKGSQFESFFFKVLKPTIHSKFKIDSANIFISGLSMGGYGALRQFILHDDYFNTAAATSGALQINYENFKKISQQFFQSSRMTDDLTKILGEASKNEWSQYSIENLLRNKTSFVRPFLFDCGTEDILFSNTLALKTVVDSLKIPATFISQPGDHNDEYWRKSIEHHFIYFNQHLR